MYKILIEKTINDLKRHGYSYLPTIKDFIDLSSTFSNTIKELDGQSYGEGLPAQLDLIDKLGLEKLIASLHIYAKLEMNFPTIDSNDRYLISRFTDGGDTSEAYRGHFDSHLFTIVLPIKIPDPKDKNINIGELAFFPNLRKEPKSEFFNIAQKILTKKHSNRAGFNNLAIKNERIVNSFNDYRPLIFMGRTTFHGNNLVDIGVGPRLSMLIHLFDPSPKVGMGNLFRLIRNR